MELKHFFISTCLISVAVNGEVIAKAFEKTTVLTASLANSSFLVDLTRRTLSDCSVSCLLKPDTCSAFFLENNRCITTQARSTIKLKSTTSYSSTIWRQKDTIPVPHAIIYTGTKIIDVSLDVRTSAAINYVTTDNWGTPYFGYFDSNGMLSFLVEWYGLRVVKTTLGAPTFISTNLNGPTWTNFARLGANRFWAIDRGDGKTYIFEDGKFSNGPVLSPNYYDYRFVSPCVTSPDESTGLLMLGSFTFYILGILIQWAGYQSVWKFDFANNTLKQMKDSPFNRQTCTCETMELANGTKVVVIMGARLFLSSLQSGTWLYNIEADTWTLTPFSMPFLHDNGISFKIVNSIYYIGFNGPSTTTSDVYQFDEFDGWTTVATIPTKITSGVAVPYNFI